MEPVSDDLNWDYIELVVFDLDGTLYNQRWLRARMLLQIMLHSLRSGSLRVPRIIRTFRRCREEMAEQQQADDFTLRQYEITAAQHACSAAEVMELVSEWIDRRPLSVVRACRYRGISQLFDALRSSNKTIAVLSDYPVEAKLKSLGLTAHITVSASDDDVRRLKPDPAGLRKILNLTGVDKSRAIMIGDRADRDGEAARRLGMRSLIMSAGVSASAFTFSSYTDEVFRPLLQNPTGEDHAPPGNAIANAKKTLLGLRDRALGYSVVGGLAAIIDLLTFSWLNSHLQPVFLAAAGSFLIASAFQYWLVSVAVYRRAWQSPKRAGMFTAVTVIGLFVNAAATAILAASLPITPALAKIGGIGLAFGLNFFLTTYVVFRK